MKIKLYFFGKNNEITDWEKIYLKRLNFYAETTLIPLNQAGIKDAQQAKAKESKILLSRFSKTDFVVIFDEKGKIFNSLSFSRWTKQQLETFNTIHFVIGGAHGLDQTVKDRANAKIAFGTMVWTRNLVRLMVLEQLYRALDIDNGGNFHKE